MTSLAIKLNILLGKFIFPILQFLFNWSVDIVQISNNPPPFPYTCLFLLNVIFEHQQKILLLENVSVRNELNVYPTYTSITWVWAKTAYIIWVQRCLQSSKYQAKIDAKEYQNKGNASYISNLNWISSQLLRIALYCLIVQCYISQWIEKKCRLFVHYS